jgi:hypothetical protein
MNKIHLSLLICVLTVSAAASAVTPKPIYVSRSDWGARPARTRDVSHDEEQKSRFLVGHLGERVSHEGVKGDIKLAQNIQARQMDQLGYGDIGYHIMIGRNGTILDGREMGALPACDRSINGGSIFAIFLGCFDYSCNPPNELPWRGVVAMARAIAEAAYKKGIGYVGRHNILGVSELSRDYPQSPGSLIMQPNRTGFVQIDVIADIAAQELWKIQNGRDEL